MTEAAAASVDEGGDVHVEQGAVVDAVTATAALLDGVGEQAPGRARACPEQVGGGHDATASAQASEQ